MTRSNDTDQPLSLDPQVDEARIRRALGLHGTGAPHQQRPEQARQRHRFVADGAVPVVMLNRGDGESGGLKERLATAEGLLDTERAAHAGTRRALQEAHAAHQALQTRLAHAEIAHAETLKAEQAARREAEEALAAALARPEPARAPAPAKAEPKRVRTPRLAVVAKEQKPVRWWTPGYRAKQS